MTKRMKSDINYSLKGIPFAEMWASGNETGVSFGFRTGLSRNIHITTYMKGNIQNTHITDSEKDPNIVWEREISIDQIIEIAKELEHNMVHNYYWFQSYYQFSQELTNSITKLGTPLKNKINNYDISPIIYSVLTKNSLVKKRIRQGFLEGAKPGFIFKGEDTFLIFPLVRNKMIKMNADLRKTPLFKFPTVEGMYRFFDYLEEEKILEQSIRFDEEKRRQFQDVLLEIYREKGFDLII